MSQDIKCFVGLHKYEVLNEENMIDVRNNIIGKVIISRCANCGKIKTKYIDTVKTDRL